MTCPICHGSLIVWCCPPGWPCFEWCDCPECVPAAREDRQTELEVARMIDEGCPNDGGEE